MKAIPLVDLKRQYASIKPEIDRAISNVLAKQAFILGDEVLAFEKKFARFCGTDYAVGLSSGTDALFVALSIMGISPGDEVIVPTYTFIATAEVVDFLGGKVVFCDIDPDTGLIDINHLKKVITAKTRFIIPVHLYGQMAPMKEILALVRGRNIQVLEDAAQAHGACYKKRVIPLAKIATFSFYPGKNLGAYGDAGAIVTNSKRVYQAAVRLRNHGRALGEKYTHSSIGFNFRMDALQGSILLAKLKYLRVWTKKRRQAAKLYDKLLAGIPQVVPLSILPGNTHVYHLYVVKTEKRDALHKFLKENGVATGIHYPLPLHLQKAYKFLGYKKGDLPNSEKISEEVLSLPIFPELTKEEIRYICGKIREFFKRV